MTTLVLTILSALIGIIGGILERRHDPEAIKKRKDKKLDEEIAEKDHAAKGKHLSDLMDDTK